MLAAQLYVMNFWKLLCEDDSYYIEGGGGICIIVEMLLFAWTLKFESPCQNLTMMINLNVFLANGWNLKLILFYFLLCFFFCLFIALAHDQAQKITFRESRKMSPIIQVSGIEMGGKMGFSFLPSYLSLSPRIPPTTYTNNNGHVLCIDIQTDR